MSKSRKPKKKQRRPNIAPIALLRPRLDGLWNRSGEIDIKRDEAFSSLDKITQSIDAGEFIPVMLRAYQEAPSTMQEALTVIVPEWLQERGHVDRLHELAGRYMWATDDQALAVSWLQGAGVDTAALEAERPSHFFKAVIGEDEHGYQGLIFVFWYTNQRRNKFQGLSLLLEHEAPWNGSIKDVMLFPKRSSTMGINEFIDMWEHGTSVEFEYLDENQAKEEIVEALVANREHDIRLPADLLAVRETFIQYVLSLADGPDTEPFSKEDFNKLCESGRLMLDVRRKEEILMDKASMLGMEEEDDDDDAVYLEEGY